jgi:S-adenosylmethionine-diacylglycerol 3-amino-3-carboxypropyl transferase
MSKFFKRLSYSYGNEDWRSEKEALKVKGRVLCITASGDRPLHLLLDDCEEVVSIDANPIQNYLLDLKSVAMHELDFEEYLAFLGASAHKNRLQTLQKLSPLLEENAQKYWINHPSMINKGILYQGFTEKQCQNLLAPLIRMIKGKQIDRLFDFTDIDEQSHFVERSWDKYYWRKIFDLIWNTTVARLLFRFVVDDPGLYDNLNKSVSIGTYFYKRMNNSLKKNLARESLLLSLFLKGRVDHEAVPPYLTEEGVRIIKKRTQRIKVKNIDIISYLESSPDNSFDCFSLSDVASYLNQNDFIKMIEEVKRVAKPGARFSIRQFFSNHTIPADHLKVFQREKELEDKLEEQDRCFVYRFMAGSIKK